MDNRMFNQLITSIRNSDFTYRQKQELYIAAKLRFMGQRPINQESQFKEETQ